MTEFTVDVPAQLEFQKSFEFVRSLKSLPNSEKYIFDFKSFSSIDPFSLVYVSNEIKKIRDEKCNAKFEARNLRNSYAAHMGFFQAFGVAYGNLPGEARGSSTYLPISIVETSKIIEEAKEQMVNPGEVLEAKAKEMCKILTRADQGDLFDVLVYSIREILRNVIEHSHSKTFRFCAQYYGYRHKVSLALLDTGIGVKESLSHNPTLNLDTHDQALLKCIEPGISGKVYKGQKRKPKGEWANSGYGLFMTSSICQKGGSFFIASGDKGLYISEEKKLFLDIPINGTALNLMLDTTRIKSLNSMTSELADLRPDNVPSPASLKLTKDL